MLREIIHFYKKWHLQSLFYKVWLEDYLWLTIYLYKYIIGNWDYELEYFKHYIQAVK